LTEFLIVTIPTELAVKESVRLLNDLTFESPDSPIKVRNVVVNQILRNDDNDLSVFLSHVREGQESSIGELMAFLTTLQNAKLNITKVLFLDTEPRGVFGLKVLANELVRE
jgi:anion-transporting  ArsA/GET3 family ATPase